MRDLRHLDLSHNNLTSLSSRQFSSCSRLAEISLASNLIDNVSADAFFGLNRLRSVRLDDNRLSSIDQCLAVGLLMSGTLDQFALGGNPLRCSCDLMWWVRAFVTSSKMAALSGECRDAVTGSVTSLVQFNNASSCDQTGSATMTSLYDEYDVHCRTGLP